MSTNELFCRQEVQTSGATSNEDIYSYAIPGNANMNFFSYQTSRWDMNGRQERKGGGVCAWVEWVDALITKIVYVSEIIDECTIEKILC